MLPLRCDLQCTAISFNLRADIGPVLEQEVSIWPWEDASTKARRSSLVLASTSRARTPSIYPLWETNCRAASPDVLSPGLRHNTSSSRIAAAGGTVRSWQHIGW